MNRLLLTRNWILIGTLLSLSAAPMAKAVVYVPRPHKGPADDEAHKKWVYAQIPWLANEQNGYAHQAGIPGIFQNEFTLLPKLVENEEYARLASQKPELQTLTLELIEHERRKVRTATSQTAENWRKSVADTLAAVREEQGKLNGAVVREAFLELWRQGGDVSAKGVLTGVIRSLPGPMQGKYFQIASVADQIEALRAEPALTDASLAAGFRADLVGLGAQVPTKEAVLELARKARLRELRLLDLIQAQWMVEHLQGLHPDLVAAAHECAPEDLDVFSTDNGERAEFLGRLSATISGRDKDAGAMKKLQSLVKAGGGEFEEREIEVPVVKDHYTIREVPPTLGTWRGYLGGDCASSNAFGYPYAPMERTYYVYDAEGTAKGYAGATVVMSEGQRTLYLHDVTGSHMADWLAERVMHALYLAADRIDPAVTRVTIATTEVNFLNANFQILYDMHKKYSENNPTFVPQEYLDGDIRALILAHPGNKGGQANYDMPEHNTKAVLFRPNPEILSGIRVKVENRPSYAVGVIDEPIGGAAEAAPEPAPKEPTPQELAQMVAQWAKAPDAVIPIAPQAQRIVQALRNTDQLPVADYYNAAAEALKAAGLDADPAFIDAHPEYFERGQLAAPDAMNGGTPETRARAVGYVTRALESGRNAERVYELIGADPKPLLGSPAFMGALKGYAADPARAPVVQRLRKLGVELPPENLDLPALEAKLETAPTPKAVIALYDQIVKLAQDYQMRDRPLGVLATALDNAEEVEDDDTSLRAAWLLARHSTHDRQILKRLQESLADDEDEQMRALAAIALARGDEITEEVVGAIRGAIESPGASAALKEFARDTIRELNCEERLRQQKPGA